MSDEEKTTPFGLGSMAMSTSYSWKSVLAVFGFPALGGALFGYDIGATSYVLPQLMSRRRSGVAWSHSINDSALLQGVITSGGVFGALVGAMIVFRIADSIGRRKEMMFGAFCYVLGGLLEMMSGSFLGLPLLILGRVIYGIGCGFVMHGAPAYISEMSPSQIRGTLVSLKEAAIVVGIAVGYGVGFGFSTQPHGWQFTYGFAVPWALVLFMGCTYLPPSARWLALRGETQQARRALRFVYPANDDAVETAMNDLADQLTICDDDDDDPPSKVSLWSSPRYRRPLQAGLGVVLLQQFTGQPSVLYYAASIFQNAGIGALATVFVGIFKLLATLGAVVTVDKRGRRQLLLLGTSVMLLALLGLAIAFALVTPADDDDDDDDDSKRKNFGPGQGLIIAFIFLYISGYQLGFGPCAWLLISEIFPLKVRGQAIAAAVQANFASNLVVSLLFPVAVDALSTALGPRFALASLFTIFAAIDLYALFFIKIYVPETMGLSLEQIEAYWTKRRRLLDVDVDDAPLLGGDHAPSTE